MTKTRWQKIYSFLGFWTYNLYVPKNSQYFAEYLCVYWCMFPGFFIRKFDVLRWEIRTFDMQDSFKKI